MTAAAGRADDFRQRLEPSLRNTRDTYGRVVRADADLQTFRSELITVGGASSVMSMLAQVADNAGIGLEDETFQYSSIDELGVVQQVISVPVVGNYESVRRLLDELVGLHTFLVIEGIGISEVGSAGIPGAFPGVRAAASDVRVDLAVSVFLEDPELAGAFVPGADPALAASGAPPEAPRGSTREAAIMARLRAATTAGDADAIAAALGERLALLPPLPVGREALVVRLGRDVAFSAAAATRNLFAIVPNFVPPPAMPLVDFDDIMQAAAPTLPVRLLGVMRVEGLWHASLTDDDESFVVTAGDQLPNGVEILEVGADFAVVFFNDKRTRLTLEGLTP